MATNNYTKNFLKFASPIDLLVAYDKQIFEEKTVLHDWQFNFLDSFANDIPDNDLLMQALIAANGSGKSKYILAPSIVWMAVSFDECLSYVTSASATQLDTQTERYVNQLCEAMNAEHNEELWDIKQRAKRFHPTKSFIDLYATDEAKRAEGKHPLVDGAEFGVFGDECKSITDEIFGAMDRCTGATRRLYSSSAGGTRGEFYKICTAAGGDGSFKTKNELGWNVMRVTSFECSHIKKREIELLIKKHGLFDPWVRSAIFSEFSSVEERTVIAYETLRECVKNWRDDKLIVINNGVIRAGLDISRGGDEMVLSVWKNNIHVAEETCRYTDMVKGRKEVMSWIDKWQIPHGRDNTTIYADDGGMGAGFIDELKEAGYYCKRVLNNSKPYDQTRYANRGTELYFNFKRFVEEGQVKFHKDSQILQYQLSNRYYKLQPSTEKIMLESKDEARRKGHASPDRADACILAWTGLAYPLENDPAGKVVSGNGIGMSEDELILAVRKQAFEGFVNQLNKVDEGLSYDKNITQRDLVEKMHEKRHSWRKYLLNRN